MVKGIRSRLSVEIYITMHEIFSSFIHPRLNLQLVHVPQ